MFCYNSGPEDTSFAVSVFEVNLPKFLMNFPARSFAAMSHFSLLPHDLRGSSSPSGTPATADRDTQVEDRQVDKLYIIKCPVQDGVDYIPG